MEMEEKQEINVHERDTFFWLVREFLERAEPQQEYCMAAIDIEHFKLFNEWYGFDEGNTFLQHVKCVLSETQLRYGGVAGYIADDDFALLIPHRYEILQEVQRNILDYVDSLEKHLGFFPDIGVHVIQNRKISPITMYDYAVIALNTIKGNYAVPIAYYKDEMIKKLEMSHWLLTNIQRAIESGEIGFCLQPKCCITDGKIVGAEALVRWEHPQRGRISPGDFIPILEENGLIARLDSYLWERVLQQVHQWRQEGLEVVPISLNLSRNDLFLMDVCDILGQLTERYQIPREQVELEITESAYALDFDEVKNTVAKLREAGFLVSMDDFGSGYSSLNMLKDINLDILKLDMNFLKMDSSSENRGIGILETIVHLAQLTKIRVLAEGVENEQHVQMLQSIGCFYAQGYYYYPPMPPDQFKQLLQNRDIIDPAGIAVGQMEYVDMKTLIRRNVLSESMLENIFGSFAFYAYDGANVRLTQVNPLFCRVLGESQRVLEEKSGNIMDSVYEPDRPVLTALFEEARSSRIEGAKGAVRYLPERGGCVWLELTLYLLKESDEEALFYGRVEDITSQKEQAEQLEASQRTLESVMHMSEHDKAFRNLAEKNQKLASALLSQISPGGMIGGYCEPDFPLFFANSAIVGLLEYDSYEEFALAIKGKVINTIHPDDRETVARHIGPSYYEGLEYTTTYRMLKRDGTWFWVLDKGRVVRAEDGRLAIVSACLDLTETMAAQELLEKENDLLLHENQELFLLNSQMPSGYHRCADTPEFDFLYISDRFLDVFGYTREEIGERFDNKFARMLHPDDREMAREGVDQIRRTHKSRQFDYRMLGKDGWHWVVDHTNMAEYRGETFFHGALIDITETMMLRKKMEMLHRSISEDLVLMSERGDELEVEVLCYGFARQYGMREEEYREGITKWITDAKDPSHHYHQLHLGIQETIRTKASFETVVKSSVPGTQRWLRARCDYAGETDGAIQCLLVFSDVTELKRQEQESWMASRKVETILKLAHTNYWEWDKKKGIMRIYNLIPHEQLTRQYPFMAKPYVEITDFKRLLKSQSGTHPESVKFYKALEQMVKGSGIQRMEIPYRGDDGIFWLETMCEPILQDDGDVRLIGFYKDITKEKNQELAIKYNQTTLELLGQQALYHFRASLLTDEVVAVQAGHLMEELQSVVPPAFSGWSAGIAKKLCSEETKKQFCELTSRDHLLERYHQGTYMESLDYRRWDGDRICWRRMVLYLVPDNQKNDIMVYVFVQDIDELKKLEHLAQTDTLTGLYNRTAAMELFEEYMAQRGDGHGAMVMIDLDNFKKINDVYGHAYGDSLIGKNAHAILEEFPENAIVCRIGGDEFLVVCPETSEEELRSRIRSLLQRLDILHQKDGYQVHTTASAGYALIPEDGHHFQSLYERSDIALFAAKEAGKNLYLRYNSAMKAVRGGGE